MAAVSRHRTAPPSEAVAAERVAAAVRAELFDGTLPPGRRLREEHLAAEHGVGRHTVRAALRILVDAGLLVHERHRGAFVPPLSSERVHELYAFREVVELGAWRLAMRRDAGLDRIAGAVSELDRVAGVAPWRAVTAAHGAVHHAVVAAAGNARLLAAYERCQAELRAVLAACRPDLDGRQLADRHRHLLGQMRRGGQAALDALAADLEFGRAHLLRALERRAAGESGATERPKERAR